MIGIGKRPCLWVRAHLTIPIIDINLSYLPATTLGNDLQTAVTLYTKKRDHFRDLSRLHREKVQQWKSLDRQPRKVGKEARSVYRHGRSKGEFRVHANSFIYYH